MNLRKSQLSDANRIMEIIKNAQGSLKNQGIDQWQNNYPNLEVVKHDILSGNGYVLEDAEHIYGTVTISFDGEPTYASIHNGSWLSENHYAVIHRIAIDEAHTGLGLSKILLNKVETITKESSVHSIKVDTHKDNHIMQKLLEKQGFTYCGIINLADGNERLAYEKLL